MRSLRNRLLLSHTLPILVITSLMGIVLIFMLETQVILANLSRQLRGQAALIANAARDHPQIWADPAQAQEFVDRFNGDVTAQLMLLRPDGRMWSSSDPRDAPLLGQIVSDAELAFGRGSEAQVTTSYSQDLQDEIADAMAPVFGSNGEVVGVIRLTHELATAYQRFLTLRYVVALVLIPGLLLGLLIGFILAVTLERPLHQLAQSIQLAGSEGQWTDLPEQGPEEVQLVAQGFNRLTERLRTAEAARRYLLSSLVHELARPLTAMRAAVYALQSGASSVEEMRARLLTGMATELQNLQRLLDDLLQFYDQSLNKSQLQRRPTDLSEWLPVCLSTWQQMAEQKGLVWQIEIPETLPTLMVDPDRLSQALGNLLSNAIKYTPAGGTVAIRAEADQEEFRVHVSDSGPGIDPQEQKRIFEPFYRVPSNQHSSHGLGLGLSIVRELITAHGGQVEVESSPAHGSHFTLRLPVK